MAKDNSFKPGFYQLHISYTEKDGTRVGIYKYELRMLETKEEADKYLNEFKKAEEQEGNKDVMTRLVFVDELS